MKYSRKFYPVNIAHFNGRHQYDLLKKLELGALDDAEVTRADMVLMMVEIMRGTHGHSLMIEVAIDADPGPEGYYLADEELDAIINEIRDTNLSVHPWFKARNARATTENIVSCLRALIEHAVKDRPGRAWLKVRVWETDQIFAEEAWRKEQ